MCIFDIILQQRVSHRHGFFAPLRAPPPDGLCRSNGPAGQIPVKLGFLGNMPFRKWRPVVWQQTCTVSHLHTDSNLLVLLQTEACDPSWQHPSIRTDKLTQQQDIHIIVLMLQVPATNGTLARGVWRSWCFSSLYNSPFNCGRVAFSHLHDLPEGSGRRRGPTVSEEAGEQPP